VKKDLQISGICFSGFITKFGDVQNTGSRKKAVIGLNYINESNQEVGQLPRVHVFHLTGEKY